MPGKPPGGPLQKRMSNDAGLVASMAGPVLPCRRAFLAIAGLDDPLREALVPPDLMASQESRLCQTFSGWGPCLCGRRCRQQGLDCYAAAAALLEKRGNTDERRKRKAHRNPRMRLVRHVGVAVVSHLPGLFSA